jgi:hypothetical protein
VRRVEAPLLGGPLEWASLKLAVDLESSLWRVLQSRRGCPEQQVKVLAGRLEPSAACEALAEPPHRRRIIGLSRPKLELARRRWAIMAFRLLL